MTKILITAISIASLGFIYFTMGQVAVSLENSAEMIQQATQGKLR